MKKEIKLALFVVTILGPGLGLRWISTASAESGRTVGNGGDAIVCRGPGGGFKSVRLLDHYEGETRRGLTIDLGSAGLSVEQKITYALDRLAKIAPTRADLYREWAKSFLSGEAEFIPGIKLIDVPDSGEGYYPEGCDLEQIAIQRTQMLPGDGEVRL